MVVCEYGCRPFARALGRMGEAHTEMCEREQVRYKIGKIASNILSLIIELK
jgi:hypothetical protein